MTASKLPFVFVNMALSADGKIATANRTVTSFGSARDLRHLYELRATADAILCGARTIEQSGALLDTGGDVFRRQRLRRGLAAFPVRILVSGNGSIDPAAPIFQHRFSPIIILTTEHTPARQMRQLRQLADAVKVCGPREINFPAALRWLRAQWPIQRLLSEGGGELNDALFRAGLVDEIHLTICPKIFGGRQAPTIADGTGFAHLNEAANFKIKSIRAHNAELFTILSRRNSGK